MASIIVTPLLKTEWQGKYPQGRAQLLSVYPGLTFLVMKMFDLVSLWLMTGMKKDLQGIYLYYVFGIACLHEAGSAIFKMTHFEGKLAIC